MDLSWSMHSTWGNAAIVQLSYFQEAVSKAQRGSCLPLVSEEELEPQPRAHLGPRLHVMEPHAKQGGGRALWEPKISGTLDIPLSLDPQDGQQPVL